MRQAKTVTVIGERPTQTPEGTIIPPDATIYNAPRPLWGISWIGDFVHGIHYAAVRDAQGEPESEVYWTQKSHDDNISLDGWVVQWESEAEAIAWAKQYYADEYGDEGRQAAAEADRKTLLEVYRRQHWPGNDLSPVRR
jgi:hypothetical protein